MAERTLILWRHAKSSWDDPATDDIERPLGPRGRRAAPVMAKYIARELPKPGVVLCSPAVRTRQTLAALQPLWGKDGPKVRYERQIYEAPAAALLACLRTAGDASCVLMIGHNPGMQSLAVALTDSDASDAKAERRLGAKFPTAALCVLRRTDDGPWSGLQTGTMALTSFVRPKDLEPDQVRRNRSAISNNL